MRSLRFDRVAFAYAGGDDVVHDITLAFTDGWSALVGDNGAGKSTLLALAAGALAPTRGHLVRSHLATVAVVEQRVDARGDDVVELAARDDRAAARWRARLALDPDALDRWATLSPGERKRWQLAAALAREPDLLIVDEPSNHLDAAALARCADALASFDGVGLLVSHDRDLLARLPRQTVRVHAGTARAWPGGYDEARHAWEAEADAAATKREELAGARRKLAHQVAVARDRERAASRNVATSARMRNVHDSDARTLGAKTVASWAAARAGRDVERVRTRETAAREAEQAIVVTRDRGAAIAITGEPAPRPWLVQLALPVLRAGDHVVARDVRVAVARDQRIWLRGDNGAGKSTLLGALVAACTLPAERLLVLPQDLPAEAGVAQARAIRALDRAARGRLGQLADALGLDPDRAIRSELPSPGEARKLALALGLLQRPWLVVLDEPTNHLDLPSIERLEAALVAYDGALVLVSHDERLAAALCTSTWTIADGAIVAS